MTANTSGFVDLRVHRATESSHSDDSIWPSFTDIMMVVVMIFLMAAVVFMLRNVQLGEDIQEAATAESRALQESESLRERTAYLTEIINKTKETLALTEHQKQELQALSEQRGSRIAELEVETAELYQVQQQLDAEVESLNQRVEAVRDQRDVLTQRISSMNQTISGLNALIDGTTADLEKLRADFDVKQEELRSVEELLALRNDELQGLQSALTELRKLEASQREQMADLQRIRDESELMLRNLIAESGLKDEQIQELTETRKQQSAELAAVISELDAAQQSYRTSLQSIEQLQQQLAARSSELESLTFDLAQQQGAIEQLETLKAEQSSTIAQHAETQAQLREQLSRQVAEAEEIRRLLAAKTEEADQLAEMERSLQVEIEALSATRDESERVSVSRTQEIESLRGLYSEQTQELERVQGAYASLQDSLQQKVAEIDTLNTRIASLGEEVSTLTGVEFESQATINQLVTQNLQYQEEIGAQQRQIQDLEQQNKQAQTRIDDYKRELDYTQRLQTDRQNQIETLQTVMRQLSDDLKARDNRLETLLSENERLVRSGSQGDVQVAQLRQAYQERLAELTELQSALAASSGEVEQLQTELVELREENQLMLRPARSPVNRYVVEVFFSKSRDGDTIFEYRLPGQSAATEVSRTQLHAALNRLKTERSEGLYTKVIFPDENQLSFGEAWSFTQEIQSNYDYYSQ